MGEGNSHEAGEIAEEEEVGGDSTVHPRRAGIVRLRQHMGDAGGAPARNSAVPECDGLEILPQPVPFEAKIGGPDTDEREGRVEDGDTAYGMGKRSGARRDVNSRTAS